MPADENTLEKLRAQIDAIDDKVLDLLAERASIVKQVGELKALRKSKQSIIRPGREAAMIRRIAERTEGTFQRAAIAQMWRMIIASAINMEENTHISTLALPGNREAYWLAREYFGAFTPMTQHPTPPEVVRDVIDGRATAGVLPLEDKDSPQAWWSRMVDEQEAPRVFARLPFIRLAPSKKSPLVAIGYVTPEATGEDESLWIVCAEDTIQFDMLDTLLTNVGIKARLLEDCKIFATKTMRYYLLEVEEFIAEEDDRMSDFVTQANEAHPNCGIPISAHYLGSYAVPILFS